MDLNFIKEKMNNSIIFFEKELSSVRTSRASISILDNLLVEAYGNKTPINQLGNISVQDASMITIQVWDVNLIKSVEYTIMESNLGINPQIDGSLLRLPIPKLSEERRQELAKIASTQGEQSKIAIRNNRRDFMEKINITCRPFWPGIYSEKAYSKYSTRRLKNTDEIASNGLWLPSGPGKSKSDIERVISEIKNYFKKN